MHQTSRMNPHDRVCMTDACTRCGVLAPAGTVYCADCCHRFASPEHWLIKRLSTREFEAELDKERATREQRAGQAVGVPYERAQQVGWVKLPNQLSGLGWV